jgi:type I restriction enzyme M protein
MGTYVALDEAANYLGVSKATLRNWDRSGKLRAVRHPVNHYRAYALSDLQEFQSQLHLEIPELIQQNFPAMDVRATKSLIARLHNILRDSEAQSNIIERFDELTKLLFLKFFTEEHCTDNGPFARGAREPEKAYATRIRAGYAQAAKKYTHIVPEAFARLQGSDGTICELATALAQVSFKGVGFDVKGLTYEEILSHAFDKSHNQQFFTPPALVKFIVEMMARDLKGDICDPAAGTGGFLVEVAKYKTPYASLTALEIDERLAWVAGMNLFTHGASNAHIYCLQDGGALGPCAERFYNRFDAILTNPPFGSDFTDSTLLATYELGRNRPNRRRGILFLERCHQLLKPGGMLAFIIDEGVLNLPSTEDVRQFIIDNFRIQAIVSLPETAFMPYATVSASILFLRKPIVGKPKNSVVFFARAEKIGRKGSGDDDYIYDATGAGRLNSDLPVILDVFRTFQRTRNVAVSDLAYATDVAANFGAESNGSRLDFRYHHPSRKYSQDQLSRARGSLTPLGDVCLERNDTLIPSAELADEVILYTGLAHIEAGSGVVRQVPTPANSLKSAVKRYEPGDIIFAKMRPNLRKVALMDFSDGGYVSAECIVFTVKLRDGRPLIDPLLLSVVLRSDLIHGQIMHLIAGIGRPRLSAPDLRRVLIPSATYAVQQDSRSRYISDLATARKLQEKAHDLMRDARKMERAAVERVAKEFV